MAASPLDVCWIAQPPSFPFDNDLQTFQSLVEKSSLRFGLAHLGEAPSTPSGTLQFTFVQLEHPKPSTYTNLSLSDDDISAFASLLERLQLALGPEDEGELLIELAHLLLHLGPSFSPGILWRHPAIIQQMMDLHAERGLGHTVTDTILIVNELLEIFQKTIAMVDEVPEARVYHAVRGSYAGLIAALAAERFQAKLVCSDSLDPGDDLAPFWLNALPHHWHSSLANSPLYRQLGERILMLTRETLYQRSSHFLTPFPKHSFRAEEPARHVRLLPPGLSSAPFQVEKKSTSDAFVFGWLIPTLNLNVLEKLERILSQVADLAGNWKLRLIEAAPARRDWVCDLETWVEEHPVVASCFEQAVAYVPSSFTGLDVLVALPSTDNSNREPGTEEASWVLLHALAAKLPLLATSTVRAWFDSEEAPGVFLRSSEDEKEAAKALRQFAQEPERNQRLSEAAGRIADAQFSQGNVTNALLEVYSGTFEEISARQSQGMAQRSSASHWGATKL